MFLFKLLIISSKLTGNATLYDIATSHANKTMANHLRPDGNFFFVNSHTYLTSITSQPQLTTLLTIIPIMVQSCGREPPKVTLIIGMLFVNFNPLMLINFCLSTWYVETPL